MRLFRQHERNKAFTRNDSSSRAHSDVAESSGPYFLRLCSVINISTKFAAFLSMMCSLVMLTESIPLGSVTRCVLHIYTLCLEAIVIMAELEWPAFFRLIPFLEGWAMRGLFQIFVGVLVQTGSILDDAGEKQETESSIGDVVGGGESSSGRFKSAEEDRHMAFTEDFWFLVSSWYLIVTGIFYFLLGSLCFKRLKGWQLRKQVKRKRLLKGEMDLLAKQKDEIERLLVDTESKLQLL